MNRPPGCAPSSASQIASTCRVGIFTRCECARRSSTTRSTETIAPRRVGERTPHPLEQWRVHRHVAVAVGNGGVEQRDVGDERREQADLAERRLDARVCVVRLHRRAGDRPRRDGGQTAGCGLQTLGEREERPVLNLDLTTLVGGGEDRVRREVRKRVTRVPGDDPPDHPAAEEQRAEARERQHDELEPGVTTPPLADDLTGDGRPTCVPDDEVEAVAGTDVLGDGIGQRRALVGHLPERCTCGIAGQAGSSTRSASRCRWKPW